LEQGKIAPSEVDLIVLATITPDMPFPSTACVVQRKIGAHRAAAFDVQAACSGFIYGLEVGQQFIMSRTYQTVLVIGADKLSSIIDWSDRNTCVLFGDGAGAVVLRNRPGAHGLLTACMGADGNLAGMLCLPGGGSSCPPTHESVAAGMHYLRMDGKETFKSAVTAMHSVASEALRRCELDVSQIKCIIPHQANRRIIDAVTERLGATPEQVFVNLEKYGNTSAASVAIGLDEAVQCGRIQRGDLILLVVFGAGLTWAAAVIEW
jgi:3-oxoacyl-[acyl-carrier-protein] synthase-3